MHTGENRDSLVGATSYVELVLVQYLVHEVFSSIIQVVRGLEKTGSKSPDWSLQSKSPDSHFGFRLKKETFFWLHLKRFSELTFKGFKLVP